MNCRCGKLHLNKRKTGPYKGLFICRCGGVAGPKPLYEAIRRGIPVELWSKIHNAWIDQRATTKQDQLQIERKMIEEWQSTIKS